MNGSGRTGVLLCRGGRPRRDDPEFRRLRWAAEACPEVAGVLEVTKACRPEDLRGLGEKLQKMGWSGEVLVGACPLAGDPGPLAAAWREVGLDPARCRVVDLMQRPEQGDQPCQPGAGSLAGLAQALAARAGLGLPPAEEMVVSRRVLVLGEGLSALTAAKTLAEAGHPLLLVTPGPRLAPLSPLLGPEANAEAAALAGDLNGRDGVEVINQGELLALTGSAGRFVARVLDRQGELLEREVGAVIVAGMPPRGLNLPPAGVQANAALLSLDELLSLLDSPEHLRKRLAGQERPRVGIALGLARESSPLALRAACQAAQRLVEQFHGVVTLYLNNAKVAAPDLEELTQETRGLGVVFMKFSQAGPRIEPAGGGLCITYPEEILGLTVEDDLDLLAVEQVGGSDPAWAELAQRLGLEASPLGRLTPDRGACLPSTSARAGVWVVGAAAAAPDLAPALHQARQAALAARELLGSGRVSHHGAKVKVDRKLCTLCLTCVRVCPRGAMSFHGRRPFSNPLACTGCGTCAAECPMDAIQPVEGDDRRGAAEVRAGRSAEPETPGEALAPTCLVLACANSAALSLDQARRTGGPLPEGVRLVRVPCAGRVDPQLVLDALVQGYDGVAILDCHPGACHSLDGNLWAGLRLENLRRLLAESGLEPERVTLRHLSPVAAGQALNLLREVQAGFAALGPNPVRMEAQVRAMLDRFTLRMDESYRLI